MRISYRNYPALKVLESGKLKFFEGITNGSKNTIRENFIKRLPAFKSNMFRVSDSFLESVENSTEKLNDIFNEEYFNLRFSECYILKDVIIMLEIVSGNIELFLFDRLHPAPMVHVSTSGKVGTSYLSKPHQERYNLDKNEFVSKVLKSTAYIHILKEYAEVETVFVKGNSKAGKTRKDKIVNDTDIDVTLLDSRWFRNIVRTEGFKVRGHFRLQPYGEGLKKKKLIWIDEFQKHGYTSKAKILES